jgi:hypothetical protein
MTTATLPDHVLWACTSSGRIELALTMEDARSASHQGQCDDDVAALSQVPYVAAQVAQWDPAAAREELAEYGAWDEADLADHGANVQRLLWLLAGSIIDEELEA